MTPPWAYHRGQFVPAAQVLLTPTVQGLNYGTGVFEGIRAYRDPGTGAGHVFRLADHCRRMVASAAALRIDLGVDAIDLEQVVLELLDRNAHPGDVYVRPLAYKLALEPGTPFGVRLTGVSSALTVTTVPMGSYVSREGIACALTGRRRVPADSLPHGAKVTGGYAVHALAVEDARVLGYDDALLRDGDGHVVEAATANLFLVDAAGVPVTPPDDADLLPGITRDTVLELLERECGRPAVRRPVGRQDLARAAEVFLTGTGIEVTPVTRLGLPASGPAAGAPAVRDVVVGDGRPGPLTRTLQDLYRDAVHGQLPGREHWTTPFDLLPSQHGTD